MALTGMEGMMPDIRTQDEIQWAAHMTMFGEPGYPILKLKSGRWIWTEAFGIKGAPTVYARKKDAVAAIEAFRRVLAERRNADEETANNWITRTNARKWLEENKYA